MPPRERADAARLLVEDGSLLEELFDEERLQKDARTREQAPVKPMNFSPAGRAPVTSSCELLR